MEEIKNTANTSQLKKSRWGPGLKSSVKARRNSILSNGNGMKELSNETSEKSEDIPPIVEKDDASMSVRNKEICRLHMEETNSINNAQNPDGKIKINLESNVKDTNKDTLPTANITVKEEIDHVSISNKVDETGDKVSDSTLVTEVSSKNDTLNHLIRKKTSKEVESSVKEDNSEKDENSVEKENCKKEENFAGKENPDKEVNSVQETLNKEKKSDRVENPNKEENSSKEENFTKEKNSTEEESSAKEENFTKEGNSKEENSSREGNSANEEKSSKEASPVKKENSTKKENLAKKENPKKEKNPEKEKNISKEKRKVSAETSSPENQEKPDDEALSSESEEFYGFDSELTEKSVKAKIEFIEKMEVDEVEEKNIVSTNLVSSSADVKSSQKNVDESNVTSSAVASTPKSESSSSKAPPSTGKRNRKVVVDLTDPIYRKPFEFGWKRELVYRTINDAYNRRQGDIYYYSPSGKKVRSSKEVMDHITDPELSVDNFTFFKEPLGINDPDKEIIRDARIRSSKDFAVTPPPKVTKLPKAKAAASPVAPVSSPPTPKPASTATPKLVVKTPSSSSGGLKVKFTGIKSGSTVAKSSISKSKPAKVKKRKASSGGSSELEIGMLPPMWNSSEVKSESLTTARSWSPPTVSESTKAEMDRSCSIYCPLAMGLIPSLQCHACQCLFHPECCGISPTRNILQYVCKKCQKNWNWKARTISSTPKSGTSSMTVSLPSPTSSLVSIKCPIPGKTPTTIPKSNKLANIVGGVTTWLPPSSTIQFASSNISHNSKISSPAVGKSASEGENTSTPPTQTVVEVNGKRFIVMPKQNVVSVSQSTPTNNLMGDANPPVPVPVTAIQCFPRPPLVIPSANTTVSESIAFTPVTNSSFVSGSPLISKPSSGLTTGTFLMSTQTMNPPGVLLVPCLPHQTPLDDNVAVQPQYVLVNSSGVGGNLMFANALVQSADPKESVGKKRSAEKQIDDKKISPPAKKMKAEIEQEPPAQVASVSTVSAVTPQSVVTTTTPNSLTAPLSQSHFFMMNLAAGYSTLMHIFRYLNLKELLSASRVCRLWHDVALKPNFWQTVRMKNTQVTDWNGFANALIKHDTKHLDLRKMLVGSKPEEVKANWLEFYEVIGRVKSLKRIELCRCLSSVIENLAKHVPHLESLTATTIKSSSLSLEPLGVLSNLSELRLKGMSGLELSFTHLSNLSELKLLSITGIKNLNDESSTALGSLTKLETLEIGDCTNIYEQTVTESIPKLVNLKRLRLEKGQNSVPLISQLLEAASKLPQLEILELINFDVKPGFDVALGKCTNIKSLLMIPTYITQSATTNHIVMIGVSRLASTLKQFVWGLTLELLRVTDLFIDQCETAKNSPAQSPNTNGNNAINKKGKGDSIPILKPLIDTLEDGHDIKDPIPLTPSVPSKVDILPIPKLRKVLSNVLPTTEIRILKIPFSSTWRQTLV